jgi:hypothetical protein
VAPGGCESGAEAGRFLLHPQREIPKKIIHEGLFISRSLNRGRGVFLSFFVLNGYEITILASFTQVIIIGNQFNQFKQYLSPQMRFFLDLVRSLGVTHSAQIVSVSSSRTSFWGIFGKMIDA